MYTVQDEIIEGMLKKLPANEIKINARLQPSMRVVSIEEVNEFITAEANMVARKAVADLRGTEMDTNPIEKYQLNRDVFPLLVVEENFVVIYYAYTLIKED